MDGGEDMEAMHADDPMNDDDEEEEEEEDEVEEGEIGEVDVKEAGGVEVEEDLASVDSAYDRVLVEGIHILPSPSFKPLSFLHIPLFLHPSPFTYKFLPDISEIMNEIAVDEEDMGEIDPLANEHAPSDESGMVPSLFYLLLSLSSPSSF